MKDRSDFLRLQRQLWTSFLFFVLKWVPRAFHLKRCGTAYETMLPVRSEEALEHLPALPAPRALRLWGGRDLSVSLVPVPLGVRIRVSAPFRTLPWGGSVIGPIQSRNLQAVCRTHVNTTYFNCLSGNAPFPLVSESESLAAKLKSEVALHRTVVTEIEFENMDALLPAPLRSRPGPAFFLTAYDNSPALPERMRGWFSRKKAVSGADHAIYAALFVPAQVVTLSGSADGFYPAFEKTIAVDRPRFPGEKFTASLRLRSEGVRFCLGRPDRSLVFHNVHQLTRPLQQGDGFPDLFAADRAVLGHTEHFDLFALREEVEAPVNRAWVLGESDFQKKHDTPADFFSDRFDQAARSTGRAWFFPVIRIRRKALRFFALPTAEYRRPPAESPEVKEILLLAGS